MTCNECRWKAERHDCPWDYDYEETDYAEDCIDFRYVKFTEESFKVSAKKQEILDYFKDINLYCNDSSMHNTLSRMLDELIGVTITATKNDIESGDLNPK